MVRRSERMDGRGRAAKLFRGCTQPRPGVRARLSKGLADPHPLVRHVAAIELAKWWPGDLPEASIRELLETLARDEYYEPSPFEDDYAEATATEEDCGFLGQDIVVAFAHLEYGQADFVIRRLLEFWSFDCQFYELGHAMLALAFPPSDRTLLKENLSGLQQRILQGLVAQAMIWNCDMNWKEALVQHGLPETLHERFSLLGYRR
jgi:hypothetical protein